MRLLISTIFGGRDFYITITFTFNCYCGLAGKKTLGVHKELMKDEQEHLKRDMELQREKRKRWEEIEREHLKHEKEMYQ